MGRTHQVRRRRRDGASLTRRVRRRNATRLAKARDFDVLAANVSAAAADANGVDRCCAQKQDDPAECFYLQALVKKKGKSRVLVRRRLRRRPASASPPLLRTGAARQHAALVRVAERRRRSGQRQELAGAGRLRRARRREGRDRARHRRLGRRQQPVPLSLARLAIGVALVRAAPSAARAIADARPTRAGATWWRPPSSAPTSRRRSSTLRLRRRPSR